MRLGGDLPSRVWQRLLRELQHAKKRRWQRQHLGQNGSKTVLFVLGCQRSGTNMLAEVLDRSPQIWVYHESDQRAFHNYRLRPRAVIEQLIQRSYAPLILLKPICDSQWADLLLRDYPNAKLVWIYRRYQDVANSAVKMWGDHQKEIMHWIYERDWDRLGWRGERLSSDDIHLVTRLYHDQMSAHEGAALFWYLRNEFYFRLGLYDNEQTLLVRYEGLVQKPDKHFARVFDFFGCPYQPEFIAGVNASSVGKSRFPVINPEIEALCEELQTRLDQQYAVRRESSSPTRPSTERAEPLEAP